MLRRLGVRFLVTFWVTVRSTVCCSVVVTTQSSVGQPSLGHFMVSAVLMTEAMEMVIENEGELLRGVSALAYEVWTTLLPETIVDTTPSRDAEPSVEADDFEEEIDGESISPQSGALFSDADFDLEVGNADGNNHSLYDGGPYSDTLSETLADVAMYYYENDLSPDSNDAPAGEGLPDRVYNPELGYKSSPDKAPHQHMVTYAMAFGVTGNLNPDDYEVDPASLHYLKKKDKKHLTYGNYPNWPGNLEAKSKETIDDLFHATANGRGRFLTAKDSREMARTLTELTSNVLDRTGSSSSPRRGRARSASRAGCRRPPARRCNC